MTEKDMTAAELDKRLNRCVQHLKDVGWTPAEDRQTSQWAQDITDLRKQLDEARERADYWKMIADELGKERAALSQEPPASPSPVLRDAVIEECAPFLDALTKQLIGLGLGGCTCGVKSPQAHWHDATCTFRRAAEALDNVEAIRALATTGDRT